MMKTAWSVKTEQGLGKCYINTIEQSQMQKLIDILWEKYGIQIGITQASFESMKDEFDLTIRTSDVSKGSSAVIERYQQQLAEYFEKNKGTFKDLTEAERERSSVDDLEQHEYLKRKIEGAATRKLFKFYMMLKREVKRKATEEKNKNKAA